MTHTKKQGGEAIMRSCQKELGFFLRHLRRTAEVTEFEVVDHLGRRPHGLTVEEVADLAQVDTQWLRRVERGYVNITLPTAWMRRVCQALHAEYPAKSYVLNLAWQIGAQRYDANGRRRQ